MLNLNLNEQNAQRTSFDALELTGYELPEEQLRFAAGGGIIIRSYDKSGNKVDEVEIENSVAPSSGNAALSVRG